MRPIFSSSAPERTRCIAVRLAALVTAGALYPGWAAQASAAPALKGSIVRGASRILPEPDGKIIAVGEPSAAGVPLTVVQWRPNGKVDPSFNASALGLLSLDSIVRLPNGKFLLAGSFAAPSGEPVEKLVKLQSDGSLDATFQPGEAFAANPLVQSDGRILLLGSAAGAGDAARPTLTRLHPDGRVDTSFKSGVVLLPGSKYALRLQPDGKLLVIGRNGASTGQPSLQRLESDGALDPQFHAAAPVASGYGVCVLAFTPDGKLLVAAYADDAHEACTLSRLEADGSLDPAFQAAVPVNGPVDQLVEDRAGQVVLAGAFTEVAGLAEPGFARLKNNGRVDTTFDPLGTAAGGIYDFVVDRYGTVTFAFPSSAVGGSADPPSALIETYSADGSGVSAFVVEPCPSCELVPAANGQEVYVRVINDPAPSATP
jgi:uncharacterized delta-60 repeat protein